MFGYLRLFTLISLLMVVISTTLIGTSFRNMAMDDLTLQTEKNNIGIVQGYTEAIWRKYREAIIAVKSKTPAEVRAMQELQQFGQETLHYFKKMPLVRINIYSPTGTLLLTGNGSDTPTLAGTNPSPDTNFIQSRLQETGVDNQVLYDVPMQDGQKGIILQTLVPIRIDDNPTAEGVVEVLCDFTGPWQRLTNIRIMGTAVFLAIFLVFLVLLYIMSRRAEAVITKQHETNIELAAAALAAQTENQDKSQFLANISHELRTPLNAIIGFSEIIKNNTPEEIGQQKYHDYINDINSSGIHLLSLINDILDYSKAEAGKLELEVSEANANKLVHNCVRLVSPRAESGQVTLVEAMPKEQLTMVTDSKKFKQIMLNLLSNAVKFTPPGGEVRVTAWTDLAEDSYVFQVKDTGIGIAPKDISRAMAPFGQVDSALSRKYEGTGLGLPLTKKFVELMGGKFEIESEVGAGTTIRFWLPKVVVEREGIVIKHVE